MKKTVVGENMERIDMRLINLSENISVQSIGKHSIHSFCFPDS